MKQKQRALFLSTMLLAGLLLFSCSEKEKQATPAAPGERAGNKVATPQNDQQLQTRTQHVQEMQAKAEALLKTLQEKETLLHVKQAELDSLRRQLEEKELELSQREVEASRTQRAGIVLVIIGVVLIVISIVLFMIKKKAKAEKSNKSLTDDLKDKSAKVVTPKPARSESPPLAENSQEEKASKTKSTDRPADKKAPKKAPPRTRKADAPKKTEPAKKDSSKKAPTQKASTAAKAKTRVKKEPPADAAPNKENK